MQKDVRNDISLLKMESMSRKRNYCLCSSAVEIFPVSENLWLLVNAPTWVEEQKT